MSLIGLLPNHGGSEPVALADGLSRVSVAWLVQVAKALSGLARQAAKALSGLAFEVTGG